MNSSTRGFDVACALRLMSTAMLRLSARACPTVVRSAETNVNSLPLKLLHDKGSLSRPKIEQYSKLSTENLVDSLEPGRPGSLKVRPDGTVIDGHHRLEVLRDRGVDIDSLPRETIP